MSKLLKKLSLSFLSFLIVFFSITPYFVPARAAILNDGDTSTTTTTNTSSSADSASSSDNSSSALWYNQDFASWYGKVYDTSNPSEIFGERYTAAQVEWVFYGTLAFIINQAVGTSNAPTTECFISNFQDLSSCKPLLQKILSAAPSTPNLAQNKAPSQNLLSMVFDTNRPLSGIGYVKERVQDFSLVPVAHAQTVGFGFNALQPIQDMWTAVRDIAFGLFVLAAIILAFMIMFRVKISPQVVITVQSAIPKIIVALILVTFSYAIAGFMVDLMYVVIGLLSVVGSKLALSIPPTTIFWFLTKTNIGFDLVGYLVALIMCFIVLLGIELGAILAIAIPVGAAAFFAGTGGSVGVVLLVVFLIIVVIVAIVAVWFMIKVIWALIKAFAKILLLTIFGPLQIVAGVVIPNFGFGAWLKSLAAALSTFVVTGALLLFSIVFLVNGLEIGVKTYLGSGWGAGIAKFWFGAGAVGTFTYITGQSTTVAWPPFLGGAGDPNVSVGILFLGVSFVLFTMIPKATELVQSFISGKPFAYGSAIGDVGQATNWAAMGTGIYANRQSTNTSNSLPEKNMWKRIDQISQFVESFTKGHH